MTASTLLLMLCVLFKFTTASCSKVPQGLRFPLGVRGIFTTKCVQKVSTRDSDNLVKPFMQVAIQTTRYYAHFVTIDDLSMALHFCNAPYVAIRVGLYLYKINFVSSV